MSRITRTEAGPVLSRAVEYHGFVFSSGVIARDPDGDLATQTRDVLAQIDELLEIHGTDKTRLLQAQIWRPGHQRPRGDERDLAGVASGRARAGARLHPGSPSPTRAFSSRSWSSPPNSVVLFR